MCLRGSRLKASAPDPYKTLIWYPAQKSGKPMTYGDYLALRGGEDRFDRTPEEASRLAGRLLDYDAAGLMPAQVAQEKARAMWALKDAKPMTGRFPVVIYAPSISSTAFENADLCEYLASQGYVVLSSPSLGAHSREMTFDREGIEAQVGDIGFLIGYAQSLPYSDPSHIAVLGFSWGGLANVFAAAKDSRISALVCLDGSVRYHPKMVEDAKYVTAARVAVPLLSLAQRPYQLEDLILHKVDVSDSFMNKMGYSDVYKVTMYSMRHQDFASQSIRFRPPGRFTEFSPDEVSQAHSWMARYVLQFLNAYLKNDAAGLAFMNNAPVKNAVPAHLLAVDAQRASSTPVTRELFAAELAKRGFEHALDAYKEAQKKAPDFTLDEGRINLWGCILLAQEKTLEAIEILKLAVSLYPESSNTYDSLAEAYERNGDQALAIKNYRRSLELDPKNDNAVRHLKTLEHARGPGDP